MARRAEPREEGRVLSDWREAFGEALPLGGVALLVTLLRLAGERLGWSATWWSRETGGVVPTRTGWLVGITWLALPFAIWLALRLVGRGRGPSSARSAFGWALLGAIAFVTLERIVPRLGLGFPWVLLGIWAGAVAGAALAWRGWPALGRRLVAYGLLSRVPVAIIMFFALRGRWGTHYDYVDAPMVRQMPLASAFTWLAFFPQLVFWVAFTVIAGGVAGTLVALVAQVVSARASRRSRRAA